MNLDWSRMGEMEYIDRMGRDGLELFRRNKKVVIVGSFAFVFVFVFVFVSNQMLISARKVGLRIVEGSAGSGAAAANIPSTIIIISNSSSSTIIIISPLLCVCG